MKIEDQVAPLELAQKLKALGFPQPRDPLERSTYFAWYEDKYGPYVMPVEFKAGVPFICAAPTVAEMGEWLPLLYWSNRLCEADGQFWVAGDHEVQRVADTEAEARAALLIALAEAGEVKP